MRTCFGYWCRRMLHTHVYCVHALCVCMNLLTSRHLRLGLVCTSPHNPFLTSCLSLYASDCASPALSQPPSYHVLSPAHATDASCASIPHHDFHENHGGGREVKDPFITRTCLTNLFNHLDTNGNGLLSKQELETALRKSALHDEKQVISLAAGFITKMDKDKDAVSSSAVASVPDYYLRRGDA